MKRFTLILLMLFGAVGFAQHATIKENGTNNPVHYNQQQRSKTVVIPDGQQAAETEIKNLGENKPNFGSERQTQAKAQNSKGQQAKSAEMNKLGENQPIFYNKQQNKTKAAGMQSNVSGQSASSRALSSSITVGNQASNKIAPLEKSLFGSTGTNDLDEILADEKYRANLPSGSFSPVGTENRKPMSDIIPTAGATETFTPSVGDHFFDPGGPGGGPTGGTPGNYPNCNCDTKTTLAGVSEIDFKFFSVFGNFDYLRIYDGTDATGVKLYDNSAGGANDGDITLADMIASYGSSTFTAASGNFYFLFHASSVVDYGGWDVEIISTGGGGGGPFPDPYCGPIAFSTVEPITLVEIAGISNRSSAVINGSPAHEDFTSVVGAMTEGQTYPLALEGNTAGGFTCYFVVFIDWNQDGILDNASERFEIGSINSSTGEDGKQLLGNITVPAGVTGGTTRMRVMKKFSTPYPVDSCTGGSYGQAEDYTINVTAGGGGGGTACSQVHPFGVVAAGGSGSSVDSDFKTAADIVVVAGEDFTLDTIEVPFLTFAPLDAPIIANVVYYEDVAGLPGTMIGSETVVPTILSSAPWANPVAFQFMTSLALTPFTFDGDASSDTTYWIEVSMGTATNQGTVFWEYSNDIPVEGQPYAKYDATLGYWVTGPAAEEVIYTFSGDCAPIGGGGGGTACSQDNPENNFENGYTTSTDQGQRIAFDITVPVDTDFTLNTATVNIWMNPGSTVTSSDITFYSDAAGAPGTAITTQAAVVPTSQAVIGNNFGFDISEVVFDIAPEMLAGQAGVETTYWVVFGVNVSAGSGFISSTTASIEGYEAYFAPDGVTWTVIGGNDIVYNFEGECEAIGGGGTGGPCSASVPSNSFENGKSFTKNLGRITAADITIAADEDMMLETINITAFIGSVGSGVNASNVDVFIYADSGTGSPGALLTSQLSLVPASQTVIGNNFGYDAWSVDLDIADFNLPGQAGVPTTYWIGLSLEPTDGSNTFWEFTSAGVNGYGLAYDDGTGYIIEPGNEVVYTFAGTCTTAGGGGGGLCSEENPNDFTFENGFNCAAASAFMTANDVTVAADIDFTLTNITASIFANGGISNVAVNYYSDAAGLPGALIGSQASATIDSQTVIGNNFGFDVNEVEMSVTPFLFAGQAGVPTKYWIELSVTDGGNTGSVFWVVTSSTSVGSPSAQFDGGWAIADPLMDGVYIWEGNCEPIGGSSGPPNDECSGAIAMSCGDSVAGTTVDATIDSSAPACGPSITSPGVWYTLDDTSGMAGEITFSMCDGTTNFDTKISVYTGSCSALVCVDGNDDSCGLQSSVTVPSNGNTKFYILVHSFGGATGTFTLSATCTPTPPPNDKIVNSIDVDEVGFPYTDPAVAMPAATPENGNPAGCDLTGANGVWYNFVSAGDGTANATIITPGGASSVTFYTAPNENSVETDLTLVPQQTNQCGPGTTASIYTLAGQAYYVFVLNTAAITDIVIDGTNLGVANNAIEGFTYHPNPTSDFLNLKSMDNIENVSLYNLLGQRVIDNKVNATTSTVDVSGLSTGTYLMKVTVNGQTATYKVLKQ